MIDVSQVSVRYTRIDREYEACLAELGNLLAEPQPGDVKKIPPGLLEPRRFLEELYSIVYDCIEQTNTTTTCLLVQAGKQAFDLASRT